jgi:hypothetical protein
MKSGTNRRTLYIVIIAAASVALCVSLLNVSNSLRSRLGSTKAQHGELLALKNDFLSLKTRISGAEGKKSLSKVQGIVQAVDEIFNPLGLRGKVKSVKPSVARDMKDIIEEGAELQLEKVDMNEVVNIFYRIENSPMSLSIKKANIKPSFENPALLNITMNISLVRPR